MTEYIYPEKPILQPDLYCFIKLAKDEIDVSEIEEIALNEGYVEQSNKHITIVNDEVAEKIKEELAKMNMDKRMVQIDFLKKLFEEFSWKFKPTDVYSITRAKKLEDGITETRKAYIRLIDMPDMINFYDNLMAMFHFNVPIQFPHIILFTKGERPDAKYKGIPISSKESFELLEPKKIYLEEKI